MPSADTIQKYYEALTPEIRNEARQVELFLRDFAEMVKINYFQFLSTSKRVQILGQGGHMLNEFDFDPDQFVPALLPGAPGYTPELDANTTSRDQRAQYFHKQFIFVVAPEFRPGDGRDRAEDDAGAARAHGLLRLLVAARDARNAQRRRAARHPARRRSRRRRPTSSRRC